MITDPAQIRTAIGWTPEKIAALKAATNWSTRVDLLFEMITPTALGQIYPFWLEETPAMALESWLTQQDRSSPSESPAFAVPANKHSIKVQLDPVGFTNESIGVHMQLLLSWDNKVNWSIAGDGHFWGGTLETGKDGLPGERGFTVELIPANYPTHAMVRLNIQGSLNTGVQVEFTDPPAP